MPWRGERDPYRVWLSEVILQQTRVAQGTAYYERFLEAFPTVLELAAATEQEVLALWQGLGYYSRARNLHAAARQVVDKYGGRFPTDSMGLLKLPGVGPYTAAAVASFAYDEPVAVIDGNVYRVLARVFGESAAIDTPAGRRSFAALADALLERERPAAYNQAIMDFGATVCTPRAPHCSRCPYRGCCTANEEDRVGELPVKSSRTARRVRHFDYVHLIDSRGRMLLRERGAGDIWQGLFDLPTLESSGAFAERDDLEDTYAWLRDATLIGVSQSHRHVLTHQELRARFWRYRLPNGQLLPEDLLPKVVWVAPSDLLDFGIPRLLDRYLRSAELF